MLLLLSFLLPHLGFSKTTLDFQFDACDSYCKLRNEFSFTFTKEACPHGGPRADDGGFKTDECDGDVLEINYPNLEGKMITRDTSLEEAMRVCGNEKVVNMPNGEIWMSPEYEYRQNVIMCRDGHADGSGWKDGKREEKRDDISYQDCLQRAYDDCVKLEPEPPKCIEAKENNDQAYLCKFCKNCDTGEDLRTCYKFVHLYETASQSCFNDDSKKGYQACLKRAQDILEVRNGERDEICKKTFIVERSEIPCSDLGGTGYVGCCCMVKGNMISHPPEEVCVDKKPFTDCHKWSQFGYCEPNHQHYFYMLENCPVTCGIGGEKCSKQLPDSCPVCKECPDGTSSSGDSGEGSMPIGTCIDLAGTMEKFDGMDDYKAYTKSLTGKDECVMMSGKFKKEGKTGSCQAAKSSKKVKCSKAVSVEVCRALGCDLTITADDEVKCTGIPSYL